MIVVLVKGGMDLGGFGNIFQIAYDDGHIKYFEYVSLLTYNSSLHICLENTYVCIYDLIIYSHIGTALIPIRELDRPLGHYGLGHFSCGWRSMESIKHR